MKFLFASINVDDFEWDEEALATIPKTQEQLEIKKFFDLLDHDSVLQTGGEMVMYKVYLTEELGGGYVRGYVPASASYKRFAELSLLLGKLKPKIFLENPPLEPFLKKIFKVVPLQIFY